MVQPNKVLRTIITRRGLSTRAASAKVGRSEGYFSRKISKSVSPNIATLAEIGDKLDYDLLLRDRTDGTELPIDPPD